MNIPSFIWRIKLRLQFTGWLQYMPIGLLSLVLFLAAVLSWLLGLQTVTTFLAGLCFLALAVFLFDLLTVKFHLHPAEPLPKRKDDLGLFDLMRSRRSCRSFQDRKLRPADFNELMESVNLHSTEATIGAAPIRFEYVGEALTVWPVVGATEFLVAIAPRKYNRLAVIDVGRSLQKIVIDATRMGLGTCWIGPGADHTSVEHHLGGRFNPDVDHIICVCAFGYQSWYWPTMVRFMNANFHRRLPLSSLFFAGPNLKEPLDVDAYPFNCFGRTFEVCQWSPSSYNGQTTRCAGVMEKCDQKGGEPDNAHLTRFDFFAVTESRYYAAVALGIWCANWELGCQELGIPGHFRVLSSQERGLDLDQDGTELPRYDVSWILDTYL